MRSIVVVTGPEPGPVASRIVATTAEQAGAWGIVFGAPTGGPGSLSVHAAARASRWLHIGCWVTEYAPSVEAVRLAHFDIVTGGRSFGVTQSPRDARTIEDTLLGRPTINRLDSGSTNCDHGTLRAPSPAQPLVPVLIMDDRSMAHHILGPFLPDARSGGSLVEASVEELTSIHSVEFLAGMVNRSRRRSISFRSS